MRFVDNQRIERRQNASGFVAARRQMREQQMMISDQNLRVFLIAARFIEERFVIMLAVAAHAQIRFAIDLRPHTRARLKRQVDIAPRLAASGKNANFLQFIDFVFTGEKSADFGFLHAARTDVIAGSQTQRELELGSHAFHQQLAQKRQIALDQLLLQSFGVRGDEYSFLVSDRPQNQRHKVSVGLSGSGSGFDQQMTFLGRGARHRLRHFELFSSFFKIATFAWQRLRQNAISRKKAL